MHADHAKARRLFIPILWLLFLLALALAPWYGTWRPALLTGAPAAILPTLRAWRESAR
jgi:methyl-accepting chemotaxis protein